MKPLDTGVITAADPAVAWADQASAAAQNTVADALQNSANQGLIDLPLPQLPADLPPIEAPEFILARKISEDQHGLGAMPASMPGLNGNSTPDTHDILAGALPPEVSQALTGANTAIGNAVTPTIQAAQQGLQQAQNAAGGALSGAGMPSMDTVNAALAQLPADPAAALMNGLAIPGIPGIDTLFQPILELLSSFGTGVIGALDPTAILSQSSKVIEAAMEIGKGSVHTVEQLWQGQASRSAQTASQQAQSQGTETSQRGIDISALTQRAAAVVEQGNAQLLGIASTFATQAAALVPVALTPPGQAALIGTATEHLGQAVTVANMTRGDLAGKTAELTGLVNQLIGQSGLPAPQEVAQAVVQNIGEPIMSQAQGIAGDTSTQAAGLLDSGTSSANTSTSAAGVGTPHSSTSSGSPGYSLAGRGGSGSSGGSGSGSSTPKVTGVPGSTVSPIRSVTGVSGTSMGTGTGTGAAGTGSGSSFMGGGAGAGAGGKGGSDDEHSRNVDPYQSRTGNDDLTGPLGESTPDVIGATHPDELVSSDYEQDQF